MYFNQSFADLEGKIAFLFFGQNLENAPIVPRRFHEIFPGKRSNLLLLVPLGVTL